MSALTIDEIIEKTTDLPSIPEAALSVVRMANDVHATASAIADRIAHDQSLTARVLRLSNSAYYGLPRQITNLQDAVVLLGMKTVRHLALVASTFPWLTQARKGYALGPHALWEHSIAVSIGSQLLAGRTRGVNTDEAFTGGLLHDIGKVVLSMWLEDKISGLVSRSIQEHLPFDQIERETLGFDHAEVGAYLAERWNLPDGLTHSIRYHHCPNNCSPTEPLVDVVHIADGLAMSLGYGLGGDGLCYQICPEAIERLGLDANFQDSVAAEMTDAIEKAMQIYGRQ